MKTLAIIGAGELGMQIANFALSDNHYSKVVFFDDYFKGDILNGYKILGTISDIQVRFIENCFDEVIIGIGYNHLEFKKKLFLDLKKNKIPIGTIIHSSSWIDKTATINNGCVIYPRSIIDAKSIIEENCIINLGCIISHDSVIKAHSFVSPGVTIAGFVQIGEMCNLGINATVIDGLKIVSNTKIGGGCVVIKDIIKNGLYVGNPHRFVR
jgi:sugar O-acyltransferase (sialic acid O-acetyltransferase NeuD family)